MKRRGTEKSVKRTWMIGSTGKKRSQKKKEKESKYISGGKGKAAVAGGGGFPNLSSWGGEKREACLFSSRHGEIRDTCTTGSS